MLHFLQNFVYYLTLEVVGPNAHEMQTGLAEARDMDQVCLMSVVRVSMFGVCSVFTVCSVCIVYCVVCSVCDVCGV